MVREPVENVVMDGNVCHCLQAVADNGFNGHHKA